MSVLKSELAAARPRVAKGAKDAAKVTELQSAIASKVAKIGELVAAVEALRKEAQRRTTKH